MKSVVVELRAIFHHIGISIDDTLVDMRRVLDGDRVFEGEAALAELHSGKSSTKPEPDQQRGKSRANKPSGAIDDLYRQGFFATERTLAVTMVHLGKDGFNFSAPSILMALKAKDYLQRRGTKGSYRFVQKYPPA